MTTAKRIAYLLCLPVSVLFLFVFLAEAGERPPDPLEGLTIREGFVASGSREVGRVAQVGGKGRLVILHREEKVAYYAREKDPVYERDAEYRRLLGAAENTAAGWGSDW